MLVPPLTFHGCGRDASKLSTSHSCNSSVRERSSALSTMLRNAVGKSQCTADQATTASLGSVECVAIRRARIMLFLSPCQISQSLAYMSAGCAIQNPSYDIPRPTSSASFPVKPSYQSPLEPGLVGKDSTPSEHKSETGRKPSDAQVFPRWNSGCLAGPSLLPDPPHREQGRGKGQLACSPLSQSRRNGPKSRG